MNKIRLIITSIISIVLVSMLLIGSTYSIFTTSDIDNDLNVYKTGDLNIKYSSNNVKITDVTPMTIEEADAVIPHRITVTNNGNVAYQFDVILSDTTSGESNTIDYQYIMTKVGYLEPKKLSNCTNNVIKEDVILLPGEVVDIDVRVWLSDNLSNSEIGKSFYAKLQIDGQAIYNDNTEIDNSILSLRYMKTSSINDFRSDTYRTKIKTVSFVDYIDTTNASIDSITSEKIIWDMSEKQDNSVVAWLESHIDDGYYNLYIGSKEKIYAKSLGSFFQNMTLLSNIIFNNLSTSLTTAMNVLFGGCNNLANLDLSSFNTLNVNNMNSLVNGCSNLMELKISKFQTSNVTNMNYMFYGCSNLLELDVSNFDTSKVELMSVMFYNCNKLINLDVSKFDTKNVVDMSGLFNGCSNLTYLDVSNFDTNNVVSMSYMFSQCNNLVSLDVINWNTAKVKSMTGMFNNCSSLAELNVSNFDTVNVTSMNVMFSGCVNLSYLDLSSFDTVKVTTMNGMFSGCSNLTYLDVSNFDTGSVTNMAYMFQTCGKLTTTLIIRNVNISNYSVIFGGAATTKDSDGNYIGHITINYIPDNPNTTDVNESTEAIVDAMIATGTGNIEKGCFGINCPVEGN